MRALVSTNLLLVSLNQAVLSVGSALLVVLFARWLEQVAFGELRYVIAVLAALAFCSLPGIGLIMNRSAGEMTGAEIRILIHRQFQWGIFAIVGGLLFAAWHIFQGEPLLARAFAIGGLLAPIANLYLVPGLICAGRGAFKRKIVLDFMIITAAVIGAMIGIVWFTALHEIIAWYLGFQALATLTAFYLIRDNLYPTQDVIFPAKLTEHVREGIQLTVIQIPFLLIPALEKVLLYLILGPIALAIFVIAVLPIEHFKSAFRSVIQVYMLPYLNQPSTQSLIHWISMGLLVLTGGALFLALFILYGMPLLFLEYEAMKQFSLALMFSLLPLPIHVIAVAWIAKRRLRTLSEFALVSVVFNLGLIATGAWLFGLWGAVVGKILYEAVLAAGLIQLDQPRNNLPV